MNRTLSDEKEEYISGGVYSKEGRRGGSLGGIEKAGIETAATMSRAGKAPPPSPQPEPFFSHNHTAPVLDCPSQ